MFAGKAMVHGISDLSAHFPKHSMMPNSKIKHTSSTTLMLNQRQL